MDESSALARLNELKDQSHRWLGKFGLSRAETEDIFQDAMVKVIQADNQLSELENLDGWFYRVLSNAAIDVLRKRKLMAAKSDELAEALLADKESEREICGCVSRLMDELAEGDRDVLKKHFFGKRTLKELSAEIGISESALRVRAMRARERLKALFKSCCNPGSLADLRDCDCT